MEQTSYNIKTELPGLLDHSRRIMGMYKWYQNEQVCFKRCLCRCPSGSSFFDRYADGFADSSGAGESGNDEMLR